KLSRLSAPVGEVLTVTDVLLFANGADVKVGLPKVEGATVKLEVLQHDRGDKVRVFKKKRRKRYRKTQGHRQHFTEVIVREISCAGESAVADETVVQRARTRAAALEKMKLQIKKPTRKEKIAADAKKG